uniref:Retrotransposon Copia-like N-terminal domain-containing protein n=1 Tax=Nicotiana tabacum TaxID=4097 RepID=A0A1S4DMM6_TOBAC|nr:PREDICTED: uncharacterized protein LOC107831402 [Nicotiana tabacum]
MTIEDGSDSGTSVPAPVVIDHNHPLYLHPSDAPGSLSVGIQLIGMENYTLWDRAMRVALLGRNKLGFIDGIITRDTFGPSLGHQWDRCNAIVVSWLTGNVSKELLSRILFRSNALLVWKELQERFNKVNGSRLYSLHKEIFTLTQGTSSVSVYYSRLKDLCDEYDSVMPPPSCDYEKSKDFAVHLQYQRLLQFLMGLNEGYSQARSQILMKSKVINVNQVYALIVQDESQKLVARSNYVTTETLESAALFTARNNVSKQKRSWGMECDYCNGKGHTRDGCFKLIHCGYCNKKGHLKENCYKLIGYHAGFKSKARANVVDGHSMQPETNATNQGNINSTNTAAPMITQEQYNMLLNMLSKASTSKTSANLAGKCFLVKDNAIYWIVDTGATNHMTGYKSLLLDDGKVGSAGNVQMPTGESAKVTKIGNSPLEGGDTLKDVICILSFKFNILSMSKLTKELNCCAMFFPEHFIFQDLCPGKVKATGSREDDLYILRTHHKKSRINGAKAMTVEQMEEPEIWHRRLGHVPMVVIRKISSFRNKDVFHLQHCDVYPLSRQTRLLFSVNLLI